MDRLNSIYTFIVLCLTAVILTSCTEGPKPKKLKLPEQIKITHDIRFTGKPLKYKPNTSIQLKLTIESTEHPEIHDIEPLDQTLLVLNNDVPQTPSDWTQISQTDYKRSGILTFPTGSTLNTITLIVFDEEEVTFNWTLPTPNQSH